MEKHFNEKKEEMNYLKYLKDLREKYVNSQEILDMIDEGYLSLVNYHNVVLKTEYNILNSEYNILNSEYMVYTVFNKDAKEKYIKDQNFKRNLMYSRAIDNIKMFNKLAKQKELPAISGEMNIKEKEIAENFIGKFVKQIYDERYSK